MTDMDPELIKKELIDGFKLILELDSNPEMLKCLPKHSLIVDRGKRKMIVSTKKDAKALLL